MRRLINLGMLLLCLVAAQAFAQNVQTGTIEGLDQDNGYVTISGTRFGFSDRVTQVYLEDRLVGPEKMDVGMVVRFTLDASGTLLRVEIIGPNAMLRVLQEN
tara:strand:- start:1399 stop:1704 length:306 start_codon:yes stop_codon:yes gene_type:complete